MNFESLPVSVRIKLIDACDVFEDAWKGGLRPRIEDHLGEWKEPGRAALFRMLLEVEVLLRTKAEERPTSREYIDRFESYVGLIHDVFRDYAPEGDTAYCPPASTEPASDPRPGEPGEETDPATTVNIDSGEFPTTKGAVRPARATPRRIGRFRVLGLLGEGNFLVYHAYDKQNDKQVAIKIARPDDPEGRRWLKTLAEEARKLAGLKHPRILKVYEYVQGVGEGMERDGYIVLEYVEGQTLETLFQTGRQPPHRVARIVELVADALHHTHLAGLVHRDLKPSNILLDGQGEPHVCDFGLALEEVQARQRRHEITGTVPYMAPEQVLGETHRLEGRTDIWALGVILYRGLTGKLPFAGAGTDKDDVFQNILQVDPKPLRIYEPAVDPELEHICLRCLYRPMNERYLTAADLAEDLRAWLDREGNHPVESQQEVVPKGLLPFDFEDADFFLSLLPGPKRADGLPESVRFWKERIESLEGDKAFRVGLLYGPSGGGKSSFVKAGLLPNLNKAKVRAIYLSATPEGTETRLLAELRKAALALPPNVDLPEAVRMLRDDRGRRPAEKVFLVLDQFEQWIQAHPDEPDAPLVRALRQCDGPGVQALVLVRDDFWMAVSRFFRSIEVPIVQGGNSAAVELFDSRHARKVLERFGRALGRLSEEGGASEREASMFLDEAVKGLTAPDDRVIPVRLSLFAEVVRHRPWTRATLHELGGVEGIGVKFLEDRFESSSSPYRLRRKASQKVLQALLPPPGSDIRGALRAESELRAASGSVDRPGDFAELMRVLDVELRLVATVEPDGPDADGIGIGEGPPRPEQRETYYQLAHDYLIRPVRQWLEREQRSTTEGRSQLRLKAVTSSWLQRPGPRQLPSLLEWFGILKHVPPGDWSPDERRLMRAAARHHLIRSAAVAVLAAVLVVGGNALRERVNSRHLVDRAVGADYRKLPELITDLKRYPSYLLTPELEVYERRETKGGEMRIHEREVAGILLYRLAPTDERGRFLHRLLLAAPGPGPEEVDVIRTSLVGRRDFAGMEELWRVVRDESFDPGQRLRAAAALASLDPDGPHWNSAGPAVAKALLGEDRRTIPRWVGLLKPVLANVVPKLSEDVRDSKLNASARAASAEALTEALVLLDRDDEFAEPIADAPPDAFRVLVDALEGFKKNDHAIQALDTIIAGDRLTARRANAGAALMALGRPDLVWKRLLHAEDPNLRSFLIDRLGRLDVNPLPLIQHLREKDVDAVELQGVLLSLAEIQALDETRFDRVSHDEMNRLVEDARRHYRDHAHPGVHSAAELLLRRLRETQLLKKCDEEVRVIQSRERPDGPDARDWVLGPNEHTLIKLRGPRKFLMGSPVGEAGRFENESPHFREIKRPFAVATKEVTIAQYQKFDPNYAGKHRYISGPRPSCAMNEPDWFDAVAYCNWLSEQAGIDKSQWCYPEQVRDLRLMPAVNDADDIPKEGRSLIVVADVKGSLHFRVFDAAGTVVVDLDEGRLKEQGGKIKDLGEKLKKLWPPQKLEWGDKHKVVTAVRSIVGLNLVVSEKALERYGYRLPTEAEWEHFCRAGTTTARPFGDSEELFPRYGFTWLNSGELVSPVGTLLPNQFGLFDVLGNLWEWCHDTGIWKGKEEFHPYPEGTQDRPAQDPGLPAKVKVEETYGILRGGAFDYAPSQARSAYRYKVPVEYVEGTIGFRVVRTLRPGE